MLMELQLNGHADGDRYARRIREWLAERDGSAAGLRRRVTDKKVYPSLRPDLHATNPRQRASVGRAARRKGLSPSRNP
jgi:hypothetical protein